MREPTPEMRMAIDRYHEALSRATIVRMVRGKPAGKRKTWITLSLEQHPKSITELVSALQIPYVYSDHSRMMDRRLTMRLGSSAGALIDVQPLYDGWIRSPVLPADFLVLDPDALEAWVVAHAE
jgi:hypothetical protein